MRKQGQGLAAAKGARRATGAAAERDGKGRFSARRKRETVLRLLRGEDLERKVEGFVIEMRSGVAALRAQLFDGSGSDERDA